MADILSPMEGKVWKIIVSEGSKVQIDDEVIILEAMKMETPIYSPVSGIIAKIKVKEGDAVTEDQLLVVIE